MALDLALIWALLIAFAVLAYVVLDGFDLGVGILFPLLDGTPQSRHGDELRRAGLGRQRDLAGARRRRAVRRVPARLCDHPAGALCPGDRHAARPRPARRRVRVPLEDRARQVPVGLGLRRRLACCRALARHHARRADPGHQGRRPRLCRRLVRLADAVQPDHRGWRWSSAMRCSAPRG